MLPGTSSSTPGTSGTDAGPNLKRSNRLLDEPDGQRPHRRAQHLPQVLGAQLKAQVSQPAGAAHQRDVARARAQQQREADRRQRQRRKMRPRRQALGREAAHGAAVDLR